jgi:hypothetical protein
MVSERLIRILILFLLTFVATLITGCIGGYEQPNRDIGIIKLNSTGGEEWCTIIDSHEDDYAESIIQTSDEGFSVAGTMALKGAIDPRPRLTKLSPNGIVEWDQIYFPLEDELGLVLQTQDGNYIGSTNYKGMLIFLDRNGTYISQLDSNLTEQYFPQHKITLPNTSLKIFCPAIQVSNSTYVFTCFTWDNIYSHGIGFAGKPVTLLFMNESGNIVKNITIASAGTWNDLHDLIPTDDGGYAILVTRSSWERKVNPYPKRCDDPAPPPPK